VLTSVSDLVLGIFAGDGLDAVGVASRLADAAPLKRVLPIVTDFGAALEGAIVCASEGWVPNDARRQGRNARRFEMKVMFFRCSSQRRQRASGGKKKCSSRRAVAVGCRVV